MKFVFQTNLSSSAWLSLSTELLKSKAYSSKNPHWKTHERDIKRLMWFLYRTGFTEFASWWIPKKECFGHSSESADTDDPHHQAGEPSPFLSLHSAISHPPCSWPSEMNWFDSLIQQKPHFLWIGAVWLHNSWAGSLCRQAICRGKKGKNGDSTTALGSRSQ